MRNFYAISLLREFLRTPAVLAACTLAACSRAGEHANKTDSETTAAVTPVDSLIRVNVVAGKLEAPRRVAAGWRRMIVDRGRDGHIVVAFHLDPQLSAGAFLAQLDSGVVTPPGAVALGGAEGATTELFIRVPAGRIIVACLTRHEDGHRHSARGEWAEIEAEPPTVAVSVGDSAAPTPAAVEVELNDFAYLGSDRWPDSTRFLNIRNTGRQDHLLRVAQLRPNQTIGDWVKDPAQASVEGADFGVARLGPGHSAYLPVKLKAGTYVLYCLTTDPKTRKPHVELGMMRQINVFP